LAALHAGQYVLVKASIAGAIVTNTLFMLGVSFLLGGLNHHVQEYNRNSARLQASLLFLATIAMLIPSVLTEADANSTAAKLTQNLSAGLAVVLIVTYGLGLAFSLNTHREFFSGADHIEPNEAEWPLGMALGTLAGVTVLVAFVSEVFVESVQQAAATLGLSPAFVGFIIWPSGITTMPARFRTRSYGYRPISVDIVLYWYVLAAAVVLLDYSPAMAPIAAGIVIGRSTPRKKAIKSAVNASPPLNCAWNSARSQIFASQCLRSRNGHGAELTNASVTKSKPSKPQPRRDGSRSLSAHGFLRIM
jgi:Ca2+:H+ antiporter